MTVFVGARGCQFPRPAASITPPASTSRRLRIGRRDRNDRDVRLLPRHIALTERPSNPATYIMCSPREQPDLCGVIVDHLKANNRCGACHGAGHWA